jgi:hypothetical protein
MGRKLLFALLAGLSLLPASAPGQSPVRPADYDEFWVWGGVDPSAVTGHARRLYVLQGHIAERAGQTVFTRQGIAASGGFGPVVLVYRLKTLAWNRMLRDTMLGHVQAWEYRHTQVLGVQLDFDARTQNLDQYADFLRQVRRDLPAAYGLGVTGLLDWATGGDPASLESLRGVVDEIVFQTYQGRRTIPSYPAYLQSLAKLRLPFKIGLVENGAWDRRHERLLGLSGHYRGAVVFLLPAKR